MILNIVATDSFLCIFFRCCRNGRSTSRRPVRSNPASTNNSLAPDDCAGRETPQDWASAPTKKPVQDLSGTGFDILQTTVTPLTTSTFHPKCRNGRPSVPILHQLIIHWRQTIARMGIRAYILMISVVDMCGAFHAPRLQKQIPCRISPARDLTFCKQPTVAMPTSL